MSILEAKRTNDPDSRFEANKEKDLLGARERKERMERRVKTMREVPKRVYETTTDSVAGPSRFPMAARSKVPAGTHMLASTSHPVARPCTSGSAVGGEVGPEGF